MNKIPENQILVIFGASGDLTRRKLLPSLFELFLRKLLPKRFLIVGVARTKQNTEEYRTKLREAIIDSRKSSVVDGPAMDGFLKHIYYISMDTTTPGQYPWLARQIDQMRVASDIDDNILYYLATPPYDVCTHSPVYPGRRNEPFFQRLAAYHRREALWQG